MLKPANYLNESDNEIIKISIDDQLFEVLNSENLAATLMRTGKIIFRETPKTNSPRGAYCMMGICFECLVEVNGMPSQQACMIEVKPGMCVRTQKGARNVEVHHDCSQ